MWNDQFHIEYNHSGRLDFAFGFGLVGSDNEAKLYNLLKTYDNNYYLYVVAEENFDRAFLDVIKSENYNLQLIIDTSFYLNICLRMINTLDDILLKIMVYSHLHFNGFDESKIPKNLYGDNNYKAYYKNFIKNNSIKYPNIGTQKNRKTRKIRNDITHDGESLIISNPVSDGDGIYSIVSFEGLKERNINLYIEIINNISSDLKEIKHSRRDIETIILTDKNFIKNYK